MSNVRRKSFALVSSKLLVMVLEWWSYLLRNFFLNIERRKLFLAVENKYMYNISGREYIMYLNIFKKNH